LCSLFEVLKRNNEVHGGGAQGLLQTHEKCSSPEDVSGSVAEFIGNMNESPLVSTPDALKRAKYMSAPQGKQ
jgi:hypothetical protein